MFVEQIKGIVNWEKRGVGSSKSGHRQNNSPETVPPCRGLGLGAILRLYYRVTAPFLCLLATASGAGLEEICNYIFHIIVELNRIGKLASYPLSLDDSQIRGLPLSCSLLADS